jgi:PLP dependent protein
MELIFPKNGEFTLIFDIKRGTFTVLKFNMIDENTRILRQRISEKCIQTGRNPDEIKLIAVSKNFGSADINSVFEEGIRDFGENRAQELTAKYAEIGNKVIWHFIGHLQRNKVRFAVKAAEYIHSVDSLLIASEINRLASADNKIQKILLQVKTSEEESKSGLTEESEIFDLVEYCAAYKNLDLVGLMTIAPFTDDTEEVRRSFRYLKDMREEIVKKGFHGVKELSMGMTLDFETAIEEGATMLRIGSAIFGERIYKREE